MLQNSLYFSKSFPKNSILNGMLVVCHLNKIYKIEIPYYSKLYTFCNKSPPSGSWGEVSSRVALRFPLQLDSGLRIQYIFDYTLYTKEITWTEILF